MTTEGVAANELTYCGWVPNLDGSISFSSFGRGMSAAGVRTRNVGGFNHRFVISYQRRNLRDALFPPVEFLERFFNTTGSFFMICVAETEGSSGKTDNTLAGILCMVRETDWRERVRSVIEDAMAKLGESQRPFPHLDDADHVKEEFGSDFKSVVRLLRQWADFSCEFTLPKTGIATLTAPNAWRWQNPTPNTQEKSEERYIVCSQLFYFLKDLGHRHQHHSPRTDTICDLYPKGDGAHWKFATFRRIYLKITDYEWRKSEEVYFSTLGILSYLRSFYDITKKDLKTYDLVDKSIVPLANIELSTKASQKTMNKSLQQEAARAETSRNWTVGVLGLLLSFLSLSQIIKSGVVSASDASPWLIVMDKAFLGHPEYFFIVILALVVVGRMTIGRQRILVEPKWTYSFARAVQGLPQLAASVILALIAVSISFLWYVAYWVVVFATNSFLKH